MFILLKLNYGSLTPLAIHKYVYFIEIKLFKNYSNFDIEVNVDKRSNLEHHVKEAATLAMTTV